MRYEIFRAIVNGSLIAFFALGIIAAVFNWHLIPYEDVAEYENGVICRGHFQGSELRITDCNGMQKGAIIDEWRVCHVGNLYFGCSP